MCLNIWIFANKQMNNLWTGPQVAQIVGITYDTLDYWLKSGLVKASIQGSKSRERSYYSFSDIVAIATIKTLRDSGFSLQKLKKASEELWQKIGIRFEQGLRGGVVVADRNQLLAVLYTFGEAVQIMSLLQGGQLVLPLDNIVSEIQQQVNLMSGGIDMDAQIEFPEKVNK